MKTDIKGENYPGIEWDHWRKVMAERNKATQGQLNEMREKQITIGVASTQKPVKA